MSALLKSPQKILNVLNAVFSLTVNLCRMESVNLRDVPPSVMLTGPSGCGKTTVAMTVARRLNMNVHKVKSILGNCK